jgi:hypothetical protein
MNYVYLTMFFYHFRGLYTVEYWIIMNDDLGRTCKEAVVDYYEVLFLEGLKNPGIK